LQNLLADMESADSDGKDDKSDEKTCELFVHVPDDDLVEVAEKNVVNHGDGIPKMLEKYEEALEADQEPVDISPVREAVYSTMLSQGEILSRTKAVLQALETLQNEHLHIMDSLVESASSQLNALDCSDCAVTEKVQFVQRMLGQLELGIGESQVSIQLTF